jgi:hypothetical protein
MLRALSVAIAVTLFPSPFARSAGEGDCWCTKNATVRHVSQSECDAIGGTGYKTKQEAVADALTGLSSSDAFHTISAAAANKFDTKEGYQYVIKFEEWVSEAAVHALSACGSTPNANVHCDIVFVVGIDGRISKVLFGPSNSYEQCVAKSFRVSGNAPKPPADSWPMQIRLIDGRRPKYTGGDPPFVSLNAYKP